MFKLGKTLGWVALGIGCAWACECEPGSDEPATLREPIEDTVYAVARDTAVAVVSEESATVQGSPVVQELPEAPWARIMGDDSQRSQGSILRVVRQKLTTIKALGPRYLKNSTISDCQSVYELNIAPTGGVLSASLILSTCDQENLEASALAKLREMNFGAVSSGVVVPVHVGLGFARD